MDWIFFLTLLVQILIALAVLAFPIGGFLLVTVSAYTAARARGNRSHKVM